MILGLALIPSKAFQDEVNAYRKRYDAHYATIMPHITIKEHFKINEGDLDAVKETIKSRIEGIPPIEVHATKASNFAPITNVIYFKVAKTDNLEKLFNQFNSGDFYGRPEHPFVPHFTIAQGLTSQEFEDILGQLNLAGIDYKEAIEQLSLVYYDESAEKWKVLENFNFA